MTYLVAQNGLSFSIDIVFTFKMESNDYKWFHDLFKGLVEYKTKISDDGISVEFFISVNDEISKYGRFKDVPSKTEVERYLPILMESEIILKSDVCFLRNTIEAYVKKERFKGKKEPDSITVLLEKFKDISKFSDIRIKNLVLQKKNKKQ